MQVDERVPYQYDGPIVPSEAAGNRPNYVPGWVSTLLLCSLGFGASLLIVLIFACPAKFTSCVLKLEEKNVSELASGLHQATRYEDGLPCLEQPDIRDKRGAAFYEAALKHHLLNERMVSKLVSMNSLTDARADKDWIDRPDGRMPDHSCSFTAPRAAELAGLWKRRGSERVVVITYNARNWKNHSDQGVLVVWSDGDTGEWLTFDDAHEQYGITAEEWADPANKLFGKKAPFQFTYQ